MEKTVVILSIGSNIEDREFYINSMEQMLLGVLGGRMRVSGLMATEAVGVSEPQLPYLNKVVAGYYAGAPYQLLDDCQMIESRLGRVRTVPKGPRTADIDILVFGGLQISDVSAPPRTLVIPHPELLNRRFCLEGMVMISPDIKVPLAGGSRTAGELYEDMDALVAAQNVFFLADGYEVEDGGGVPAPFSDG
ncbi:MAG: 2-amino-4-hydroxy-6-hydroxymethyldihydropteridine diphosphokinase [Chitinispirillia bacterium]|nr:2-amino-4-hydroxy-6-hydroxymethyldihydropteridine diphosphokinase [Chitinispirillia bacterium]MCL2184029.1 2-amino-4-hydroxy-6-hydroxymethyldihydropteridine diphosphokinase [Chitinispirillia bacterium]